MKHKGGILEIRISLLSEKSRNEYKNLDLGPYALLCITDTGAGIEEENIHQIFDPFFTTKTKGHGTGMGLAMVHGIIKNHGGEILVNSKKGEGTEFRLILPLIDNPLEIEGS